MKEPKVSLRDYFAGKALSHFGPIPSVFGTDTTNEDDDDNRVIIARDCYLMADSMLAARAKPRRARRRKAQ